MKAFGLVVSILAGVAQGNAADGGGWRNDPQHPQLQYRVSCLKGEALSIFWRNGYPGEVSFKAQVKSLTYDGVEDGKIAPGGTFKMDPDTMTCSLGSLNVRVIRFVMAAPPAPRPGSAPGAAVAKDGSTQKAETPPAVVPSLIRFDPTADKLPEISPEQLSLISTGMKQQDVVAKLGTPASKLSIDQDGALVESYQYRLGGDKISIVRFTNGTVTEITRP